MVSSTKQVDHCVKTRAYRYTSRSRPFRRRCPISRKPRAPSALYRKLKVNASVLSLRSRCHVYVLAHKNIVPRVVESLSKMSRQPDSTVDGGLYRVQREDEGASNLETRFDSRFCILTLDILRIKHSTISYFLYTTYLGPIPNRPAQTRHETFARSLTFPNALLVLPIIGGSFRPTKTRRLVTVRSPLTQARPANSRCFLAVATLDPMYHRSYMLRIAADVSESESVAIASHQGTFVRLQGTGIEG